MLPKLPLVKLRMISSLTFFRKLIVCQLRPEYQVCMYGFIGIILCQSLDSISL